MKRITAYLLALLMTLSVFAGGSFAAFAEEQEAGDGFVWTRQGFFQDADENLLMVSLSEVEGFEGWAVSLIRGEEMIGWIIQQEGETLHGDLDYEETGEYIVTISEEGEDGLKLETESGEVYHFTPMEMPEFKLTVSVNIEGLGQISCPEPGEDVVFDEEYPFQSTYMNLEDAQTRTFGAKAAQGWHFVKWTMNGEEFSTDEIITVELTEDTDLVAVFEYDEADFVSGIDYFVLVNKTNPLPEGWEEALETVHVTNSVGDDVQVEARAYEAYLALKEDLEENDGIYLELDSAWRSVAEQQDIMDRFTEKYGAEYAARTVAKPGYSEHHTGLALDLYFKLKNDDGSFTDVYYNEDMVQYPEIWQKIRAKLADYGFILRYLEGKEHITGYAYEPWHIRFIDDIEAAHIIMDAGITLEGFLGLVSEEDVTIDLGSSELYTAEELQAASVQVKCAFAGFKGCELHTLRYAGDSCNTEENLRWLNDLDEDAGYVSAAEFLSDFHSPVEEDQPSAWSPDTEYTDWQWWLGRTADGTWQLVTWGY